MVATNKISFFTLLLMISFASVNAVLFTPALPQIATFFHISSSVAQQTVTGFLIGYALGQLLYGPLANRFGRKHALYMGVGLQIISSLICITAGMCHAYSLLIIGRFLLAIGSGVGLKMTFTLVNENYEPKVISQKMAYLMMSFAITPGLSVALGGILVTHFNWMSCFYAGIVYGLILLYRVRLLPESTQALDYKAFQWRHLLQGYARPFKNRQLMLGGLLMGCGTGFIYAFSALAPFVAMSLFGLTSEQYGVANILPVIGLALGSVASAQLVKKQSLQMTMRYGLVIATIGVLLLWCASLLHLKPLVAVFCPMLVIYFGLSLIAANVSTIAMGHVQDKAHGSAVMNFINMGLATLIVLTAGAFSITIFSLPIIFLIIIVMMLGFFWKLVK